MTLFLYALGTLVLEAPWYFLTTVPFWGRERIKRKWIVLILLVFALLRIAGGYYSLYVSEALTLSDYNFILQPLLLLAVYSICYSAHIVKLAYATLLTVSISMPLSMLAGLIAMPFVELSPDVDVVMEATPAWILAMALLTAAVAPFIYRLFSKILRGALSGFSAKTVLYLCATPALFFLFYAYSVFTVPYFNEVFLLITPVVGVFCAYINLRMILNLQELAQYRSDMQIQEIKNQYLLENYRSLETHYKQISETKHEMRHHLFAIRTLLEHGEYGKIDAYLSDIEGEFSEAPEPIPCGNRVIQAALGHAARRAREMGFQIQFETFPLPELSIPDADLVSLLMNLLENALESCGNVPEQGDRWIRVKLKAHPPYLCLSISNARRGALIVSGDSYASTKDSSAAHGHGIAVVRKIVDRHKGLLSFEHTSDAFCVEIALPVL